MFIDILGWIGLILVFPATWFQIIKNFQGGSAQGVSLWMFITLFLGLGSFFIVSLLRATPIPTTVQFGLGTLGAGIVLLQMFLYRNR